MKQPRNILCDKSAATVFYKTEGGKNVQEPLPEKIMNLFLSSSPLVPTLAPFTKEDPEFVALLDNAYEHIANQKDFLTFSLMHPNKYYNVYVSKSIEKAEDAPEGIPDMENDYLVLNISLGNNYIDFYITNAGDVYYLSYTPF